MAVTLSPEREEGINSVAVTLSPERGGGNYLALCFLPSPPEGEGGGEGLSINVL